MRKIPRRPIDKSKYTDISATELDQNALDTPERIIEYCRNRGFYNGESLDIEQLITSNPMLKLEYDDLDGNDAYIEKLEDDTFRIVINRSHHRNRQRFSMAHEYIHYQVHRDQIENMPKGEKILFRNNERNPIEWQANNFAGQILMPTDVFKYSLHAVGGSLSKVSDIFKISSEAARVRAESLGYQIDAK